MKREIYLKELTALQQDFNEVATTPFSMFAKAVCLTTMNMRYELVAFDKELTEHPYVLTAEIIRDARKQFEILMSISFIEGPNTSLAGFKDTTLNVLHRQLWQEIWPRHDNEEFDKFVALKANRLDINDLIKHIDGKRCVEFGCGNGAFSYALLQRGATQVTGLDFGTKSVEYARNQAARLDPEGRCEFVERSVLDSGLPNASFDFAVSNGVFHHLDKEDMPKAVKEVSRVLKPGGWFWYYIDGTGAISMDLWDATTSMLKGMDLISLESVLKLMNVSRNKAVHIMDGSNAIYVHSTWDETVAQLDECGFENFRRLTGGAGTDFDHDVVDADPYGKEKFGEGDIRILCQRKND